MAVDSALNSLTQSWSNKPQSWVGQDPCSSWDGIRCSDTRITQLSVLGRVPGLNIGGQLSSAIESLSELDTLCGSFLQHGFDGNNSRRNGEYEKAKIPIIGWLWFLWSDSGFNRISNAADLSVCSLDIFLKVSNFVSKALNSNRFSGNIPRSLGNLTNINWLDLAENELEGTIPVSDDQGRPGLDLLLKAQHFHMGSNKLSGTIPEKLFNSSMILEHVLFDHNQLEGSVPSSISSVGTLEVLRLDKNGLTGGVPANLNRLGKLSEMDMSDNAFNASNVPSWVSSLPELTTVYVETWAEPARWHPKSQLANNPVCRESGSSENSYCQEAVPNPSFYSTPSNNCSPPPCSSDQIASPNCICAYPYTGLLISRALSFSNFSDASYYRELEQSLMDTFRNQSIPVDSVALSNPMRNSTSDNFEVTLQCFPSQSDRFNSTGVLNIAFLLSNQIYKPPEFFSPYIFKGANYDYTGGEPKSSKSSHTGVIVGAVVAVVVFIVLASLAGMYAIRQKRRAERSAGLNPFANWEQNKNSGTAPQLKGGRWFAFDDLRKYTNNFSETNTIGSGGYGQVYQGTLPSGELVAIKRAAKESMQGAVEFKTEIELLSRVHHKNLKGEQMLVYEYIPNGTLMDSLSGKSGIWMDWIRRLKVALGAARGLAYLHELANPPIIHRDIKSSNILLDHHLNAKVADFGLSKLLVDSERGHVTTQVKGTMGYLDPEYYMTQQLTEKSDVYSYGVLMLELATARRPIEQGKYIVREVMRVMDTSKDLYNLHSILDPTIMKTKPKGLEKFVMLAMRCVKEYAAERPTMAEVVKEIESIIELVGLNPNSESATTSETYEEAGGGNAQHPYREEDFSYSGMFPSTRVEPQ
ncbi:hypothetical protein V8G54_032876 [Vigna mungo]|uniref:non-specific serine/threonine protein kinase n=1 Tax=Vigna mungo TaxID=3915 RepID=A0AAQ3MMZ7_VIGMU